MQHFGRIAVKSGPILLSHHAEESDSDSRLSTDDLSNVHVRRVESREGPSTLSKFAVHLRT